MKRIMLIVALLGIVIFTACGKINKFNANAIVDIVEPGCAGNCVNVAAQVGLDGTMINRNDPQSDIEYKFDLIGITFVEIDARSVGAPQSPGTVLRVRLFKKGEVIAENSFTTPPEWGTTITPYQINVKLKYSVD